MNGRPSVSEWALNDCEHAINEPTFYEWPEHTKSYWSNTWYCSFNGTCLSLCISNLILIITISYKYTRSMSGCALHHHEHFGRITAFIMHHIICWRKNLFGHFYEVLRLGVSEWMRASCCWCDCRTSLIITCFLPLCFPNRIENETWFHLWANIFHLNISFFIRNMESNEENHRKSTKRICFDANVCLMHISMEITYKSLFQFILFWGKKTFVLFVLCFFFHLSLPILIPCRWMDIFEKKLLCRMNEGDSSTKNWVVYWMLKMAFQMH